MRLGGIFAEEFAEPNYYSDPGIRHDNPSKV
jgi:hypothetical protein